MNASVRKRFVLIDLSGLRYGGFVSFTAHLFKGMVENAEEVVLARIGNNNELKQRPYSHGVQYRNVTIKTALGFAGDCLITASHFKHERSNVLRLLAGGAAIVLHNPNDYEKHGELLDAMKGYNTRVFTPRKPNISLLRSFGIEATLLPHPYNRSPRLGMPRKIHAASISRLDFDKYIEIIVQANQVLPIEKTVKMFGFENRIYTHFELNEKFPEWRKNYLGAFDRGFTSACSIAAQCTHIVDMSAIHGDGGGVQYTFLEAWDAGAKLILSDRWFMADGEVQPEHATFVDGVDGLVAALTYGVDEDRGAVEAILQNHDAKQIAARFMNEWK